MRQFRSRQHIMLWLPTTPHNFDETVAEKNENVLSDLGEIVTRKGRKGN